MPRRWTAWLRGNVPASEMKTAAVPVVSGIGRLRAGCVLLVAANQEVAEVTGEQKVATHQSTLIEIAVESVRIWGRWGDARDAQAKGRR